MRQVEVDQEYQAERGEVGEFVILFLAIAFAVMFLVNLGIEQDRDRPVTLQDMGLRDESSIGFTQKKFPFEQGALGDYGYTVRFNIALWNDSNTVRHVLMEPARFGSFESVDGPRLSIPAHGSVNTVVERDIRILPIGRPEEYANFPLVSDRPGVWYIDDHPVKK